MKGQNELALAVLLAITTGTIPTASAQSAADFQDEEYYKSTGLDLIDAAEAYAAGYTGKGVTLGVCDEPTNFLSPEFNTKKASQMVNVSAMKGGQPGVYNWHLKHGTHVSGIAAASRNGIGMQGVAYEAEVAGANLWSIYDGTGSSYSGIAVRNDFYDDYLMHPEIKVINNSWGAGYIDTLWTLDGKFYQDMETSVKTPQSADHTVVEAAEQNKLLVFAAGNFGHPTSMLCSNLGYWDAAAAKNILNVTALDASNTRTAGKIVANQTNSNLVAFFSDLAKYTEDSTIAAPGYRIWSANSYFATDGKLDIQEDGTSMAAPFVTGAGAVVQQAFPYLSARQIGDVLLSTANGNIEYSRGIVTQIQADTVDNTSQFRLNFFILDSSLNSLTKEELLKRYEDYLANRVADGMEPAINSRIDAWKKQGGLINVYYDVPLQELIGQGVLDVGVAVKGPGALNARRLSSSDISSSYTVNGTNQQQALYSVDTQGYDSVWSNDIKEIKAGYIAADSTETDLRARWKYYDTNWLSYTGTDRDNAKAATQVMMDIYNQQVKDSGLAGLSVGLYKAGAGTLALTGTNTYAGSSIAADGTLEIDGSVVGDAWSITDSNAGTRGTISGSGTIKGNLYNQGIAQPTAAGNLTVNGNLTSDGQLGLVTTNNGSVARQIAISGTANVDGSKLVAVEGNAYLPDQNYTFLTAKSINGSLANKAGDSFSGLLSVKNITAGTTSASAVLTSENNIGSLNPAQQNAYQRLFELEANTAGDAAKQQQLGKLLGLSSSHAGKALEAIGSNPGTADLGAVTMNSTAVLSAIDARGSYLQGAAGEIGSAREEEVSKDSPIIPVELGTRGNGWLKFSKSWSRMSDGTTSGHGSTMTIGADRAVRNNWKLGGFFSYGTRTFSGTGSNLQNSDYRLGIYGIRNKGAHEAFVYADVGRQHNDGKRIFSVADSYQADSHYQSSIMELGGRYSYDLDYGKDGWHKKPFVEGQVVRYNQDSYTETGAGVWNQHVDQENVTYSAVTAGLGFTHANKDGDIEINLGYKRVLSGNDPSYPVSLADAPGSTFTVHGSGLARNLAVLDVHAHKDMGHFWSLESDVRMERGGSEQNVQASATFKKSW